MATQAERRAASERAVLEATLDLLAEDGYAAVTTRRVAERAGVAQGTQRHYWPTRTGLLMATVRHAKDQLAARAVVRLQQLGDLDVATIANGVDLAWELHRGREFRALQQLWLAAADDAELASFAADFESEITKELLDVVAAVFPGAAQHPDVRAVLETGLAAIRGIAALIPLLDNEELDRRWQPVRAELIRMVASRLDA